MCFCFLHTVSVRWITNAGQKRCQNEARVETLADLQTRLIYCACRGDDWPCDSIGRLVKASFPFMFNEITQSFYKLSLLCAHTGTSRANPVIWIFKIWIYVHIFPTQCNNFTAGRFVTAEVHWMQQWHLLLLSQLVISLSYHCHISYTVLHYVYLTVSVADGAKCTEDIFNRF